MVDKRHVKEGHAHLRPPQPARLGNDHRCACSRQIDTPPIGPKHAQISLQHKTHEHIALTSIEQQVILFGNSSFVNRVVACARQRSNVSTSRSEHTRHTPLPGRIRLPRRRHLQPRTGSPRHSSVPGTPDQDIRREEHSQERKRPAPRDPAHQDDRLDRC